jgi:hypothetical protein
MPWTGWLWTGSRWQDVCQGRTLDTCSRRLHQEAEARGVVGNTRMCMTGGRRPTWMPSSAGQEARQERSATTDSLGADAQAGDPEHPPLPLTPTGRMI